MKKILSLVLALVMLALCPAMAETVEQPQTMTSPNGDYSFQVPQGYISVDAELMVGVLSTPEMQQQMAQMMGLEDASLLEMFFAQVEASNMMIVLAPDWVGNLNVQAAEALMTMELMEMMKTVLDAAMIEQYVSMGVAEEDIQTMEIQEIAGRKWYGVQLVMADLPMQTMITIENGMQYTVTFSCIDADTMLSILESFQAVVPVA